MSDAKVTIDMSEYEQLKKIRDSLYRNENCSVLFLSWAQIVVIHPTQEQRFLSSEFLRLRNEAEEMKKETERLIEKYSSQKKWYEFWK